MTTLATGRPTHTVITSDQQSMSSGLRELLDYRDLILLFVKRGFVVSYTQTILGPLWLLLRPLMTSIMYLVVFGNIARLGTNGVPGILFYMAGNALWSFFSQSFSSNANTFSDNAGLFGKVYFPRLTIPLANVISAAATFLINLSLVVVVYLWFLAQGVMGLPGVAILLLPLVLLQLGILGLSCGIIFSSLTTRYRDLGVLVGFGISLWMYATPVVYPLSEISSPLLKTLVCINPVTAPMELFRLGLFGTGDVIPWSIALSWAITLVLLVVGTKTFSRVERHFIDTV